MNFSTFLLHLPFTILTFLYLPIYPYLFRNTVGLKVLPTYPTKKKNILTKIDPRDPSTPLSPAVNNSILEKEKRKKGKIKQSILPENSLVVLITCERENKHVGIRASALTEIP